MKKIHTALTKGRGVWLPLRDVHALVDIQQPLTTDQFAQLHDIAEEWKQQAIDAPSWTQAAAYNDVAHTIAHWIETQQGCGE